MRLTDWLKEVINNMNKITITPAFKYDENDIIDVISSAVYDIGYWACIDNDTEDWKESRNALSEQDATFEDIFFHVLQRGKAVELFDVEDNEEVWKLTLGKLFNGMKFAIENKYWDGDVDSLDGEVGDIIFQYALFDNIIYG
jgi:hypothetical protein